MCYLFFRFNTDISFSLLHGARYEEASIHQNESLEQIFHQERYIKILV